MKEIYECVASLYSEGEHETKRLPETLTPVAGPLRIILTESSREYSSPCRHAAEADALREELEHLNAIVDQLRKGGLDVPELRRRAGIAP
jgi:uncharacterized protein (DUF58 family)